MNHFPESSPDGVPGSGVTVGEELSRLRPLAPSPGLRARIGAALAPPRAPTESARDSHPLGWLAERLLWAGGGAVAASLVVGLSGSGPAGSGPTVVIRESGGGVERRAVPDRGDADVAADAAAPAFPVAAGDPAAGTPAEESLAWSDEGVHYLADGFPARIYRHWVLERHPDPSGRESLLPREDVFVVPVSLR